MSAQVTEAHRKLAVKLILGLPSRSYENASVHGAAQLIADSEARATELWRTQVEELRGALALGQQNCDDAYEDLRDERDAARVELATCKDASESLLESLRAEVQRLKSDGAASAFVDMACRAFRAEAEVERLRSDRDCEKRLRKDAEELREDAIARAERAEDNLAALEQCHDDNCRGVVKIADELAVERARLDWLESSAATELQSERGWIDRAAIDAAMKEEAK